jgi:lipoprotein-anchoring transpeptidase ErfK/SrfK
MKLKSVFVMLATMAALSAHASKKSAAQNVMDEFDPSAPDAMEMVEAMTEEFEGSQGTVHDMMMNLGLKPVQSCVDRGCKVFIDVNLSTQRADLYLDGQHSNTWKISSARPGKITKKFNGIIHSSQFRIFDAKTSTTYTLKPGQRGYVENGKDLGNMPYAVFYHGPYAIHGTTAIANLGTRASAGCIRLHPDNAKKFNRAVRANGRTQTWVTVN